MPQMNPLQMLAQGRKPLPPSNPNDMADLYPMEGQLGDEAELNSIQAQRAGAPPNEVNALQRLSGHWRNGQADTMGAMSPTPAMAEMTSAVNDGFQGGSSAPNQVGGLNPIQERNVYRRNFEQEKMRQPLKTAELQNAGETQRAKIVAETSRYNTDANNAAYTDKANNFAELAQMMQAGGGNLAALSPPGKSSGGSVRMQAPVAPPNQTSSLNQLSVIRGNVMKSGIQNPFEHFAQPTNQDEMMFVQQVSGLLGTSNFGPDSGNIKQDIATILRDPKESGKPLTDLFDQSQASPQEWASLVDFFTKVRGY